MKVLILVIGILTLGVSSSYAQVDRTKVPSPGSAKKLNIAEYQSFDLENGLRVFVIEDHRFPTIHFLLRLLHDPIRQGEKAGYVDMAGELMGRGTTHRSKEQLDEEVEYLGAELSTFRGGVKAFSLKKHTEKILELMTDVLYHPLFAETEFEKLKKQALSSLAYANTSPSTISSRVGRVLRYGKDHPYGELMTEKTVNAITPADCKQYHDTYFKPNNAYLIVLGDVSLAEAKKMVTKHFAAWKPGDIPTHRYLEPQAPEKSFVALVDRPSSVQSLIKITYPIALKVGSSDELPSKVMNNILGKGMQGRLFKNLREKHGYTYGAYSTVSSDPLVGKFTAYAETRNEVTDSAIYEFIAELERMAKEPVQSEELLLNKTSMAGGFVRSLESPFTIASFAFNTAKYNLPRDYYYTFLKRLDGVAIQDIQEVAQKYIHPKRAYIEVVGKAAQIADKLERFGSVKYYDEEGNAYEPKRAEPLPEGLTAEAVVNKYLNVIGGVEQLKKIKSIDIHYKGKVMNNEVNMHIAKKAPKKSLLEIKLGQGMVAQRRVSDGKNIAMYQMGKKTPIDDKTKEYFMYSSMIFPELLVANDKLRVNLLKIELIHDKPTYVVQYTTLSGNPFNTAYYDQTTGLKVRDLRNMETPQGKMVLIRDWSDYREHEGIWVPWVLRMDVGKMITFEVTALKFNPKLSNAIFAIE